MTSAKRQANVVYVALRVVVFVVFGAGTFFWLLGILCAIETKTEKWSCFVTLRSRGPCR